MDTLKVADKPLQREPAGCLDVDSTLMHFAIITYCVDPDVARPHVHPRFHLELVEVAGREMALLSVVPFVDYDFRFSRWPWFRWRFGQTNYRIYVTDGDTGEHVVWFLGTSLDSWTVLVCRHFWKLPWHQANIDFECHFDAESRQYSAYRMTTTQSWADAYVEVVDTGRPPAQLVGFDHLEAGLVLLTHPTVGYYYRRDGRLGSYSVWHDRLRPTVGQAVAARFDLLDRLGLVETRQVANIHSVLIQHRTDFRIYLPPS